MSCVTLVASRLAGLLGMFPRAARRQVVRPRDCVAMYSLRGTTNWPLIPRQVYTGFPVVTLVADWWPRYSIRHLQLDYMGLSLKR